MDKELTWDGCVPDRAITLAALIAEALDSGWPRDVWRGIVDERVSADRWIIDGGFESNRRHQAD